MTSVPQTHKQDISSIKWYYIIWIKNIDQHNLLIHDFQELQTYPLVQISLQAKLETLIPNHFLEIMCVSCYLHINNLNVLNIFNYW